MSVPTVKKYGKFTAAATPAAVNLDLGFVPDRFELTNEGYTAGDVAQAKWLSSMGDGKAEVQYVRDMGTSSAVMTQKFLTTGGFTAYYKSGGATTNKPALARWGGTTAYAANDVVKPVSKPTGWTKESFPVFKCTTAGTSGATEPTWDTDEGDTTTDNTVTWTCIGSGTLNAAEQKFVTGLGVTVPAALQVTSGICHWVAEGREPQ